MNSTKIKVTSNIIIESYKDHDLAHRFISPHDFCIGAVEDIIKSVNNISLDYDEDIVQYGLLQNRGIFSNKKIVIEELKRLDKNDFVRIYYIESDRKQDLLLRKAMKALDHYLNAGCKKDRKEASIVSKKIYEEYYNIPYVNKNNR